MHWYVFLVPYSTQTWKILFPLFDILVIIAFRTHLNTWDYDFPRMHHLLLAKQFSVTTTTNHYYGGISNLVWRKSIVLCGWIGIFARLINFITIRFTATLFTPSSASTSRTRFPRRLHAPVFHVHFMKPSSVQAWWSCSPTEEFYFHQAT